MDQQQNENKVLTVKEVSALLRIPTGTIYILAQKRMLMGAKFGRQWRFLEQDILDYLHRGYTHAA